MTAEVEIEGRCHCGNVVVSASFCDQPASLAPRECDCDFCRMQGAAYVSDPRGRIRFAVHDESGLRRYRQGAEQADMLICARCGVLVGVCYREQGVLYAAVNVRVMPAVFGAAAAVSPRLLSASEKSARWKRFWFADARIDGSAPSPAPGALTRPR